MKKTKPAAKGKNRLVERLATTADKQDYVPMSATISPEMDRKLRAICNELGVKRVTVVRTALTELFERYDAERN